MFFSLVLDDQAQVGGIETNSKRARAIGKGSKMLPSVAGDTTGSGAISNLQEVRQYLPTKLIQDYPRIGHQTKSEAFQASLTRDFDC